MALSVKSAVLEKLIHCLLLPLYEHVLKQTESDLCDKEFVVMSVVTLHLSLFSGDLHDTVVVCAIKMFEFPLKFISLIHEFLNDT